MMNIGRKIHDFRKSKLLKGSAGFFVMKIGAMFFGYVNVWVISRFFGSEALGLFSFVLSVLTFGAVFAKLGVDMAVVRFVSQFLTQNKAGKIIAFYAKVCKLVSLPVLLFSVLLFFGSSFMAEHIFEKAHYDYYLKLAGLLIIPIAYTQINAQLHRGFKKIIHFAFFDLYATFFTLLVLIAIVLFTDDFARHIPVSVHALSIFFLFLLSTVFVFFLLRKHKQNTSEIVSYKEIMKVSFPMYHIAIAGIVINWADKLIMGAYVPDSEIGIYHAMSRIAVFLSIFLLSGNAVLAPHFSQLWEQGDMNGISDLVKRATRLLTAVTLPIFVLIIVFAEPIAGFFGSDFIAGTQVLIILAIGQFVNVWTGPVGIFLLMTGHERFNRNVSWISVLVFLIAAYMGIRFWGITGGAGAVSLIYVMRNMFYVIYVKRKFNINFLYIPFIRK